MFINSTTATTTTTTATTTTTILIARIDSAAADAKERAAKFIPSFSADVLALLANRTELDQKLYDRCYHYYYYD